MFADSIWPRRVASKKPRRRETSAKPMHIRWYSNCLVGNPPIDDRSGFGEANINFTFLVGFEFRKIVQRQKLVEDRRDIAKTFIVIMLRSRDFDAR